MHVNVWNEKLKYVKIIRIYGEKERNDPKMFYGGSFVFVFFRDINRLNQIASQEEVIHSKENVTCIQFSVLFPLHVQPINIT